MRARVAALRMTHQRIGELIGEYGLDAFLAAQEGIIDYVERVVRARLREIPDGELVLDRATTTTTATTTRSTRSAAA